MVDGEATLEKIYEHEPIRAARRIVGEFREVHDKIKSTAEGFAILDFVQGYVATDLPSATARDIVEVIRNDGTRAPGNYNNELVLLWLENYRRAYSHMIMRVLEDGADPMSA